MPQGLIQNKQVAREGGTVAGVARVEIERQTGKSVVTSASAGGLRAGKNALVKKLTGGNKKK